VIDATKVQRFFEDLSWNCVD